jgi:hypothetical protein
MSYQQVTGRVRSVVGVGPDFALPPVRYDDLERPAIALRDELEVVGDAGLDLRTTESDVIPVFVVLEVSV